MPVSATTVYDKKNLLRFQYATLINRKGRLILYTICTLIAIVAFILQEKDDAWAISFISTYFYFIILLDVLIFLIAPLLSVKKPKNLNIVIHYQFGEDSFDIATENAIAKEHSTLQYAAITKVFRYKNLVCLYVSGVRGFIVDLNPLAEEQISSLRHILMSAIEPKRFRWKA